MRHWEEIIPEADWALYQKLRYGHRQTYGTKPALLIIDEEFRGFKAYASTASCRRVQV